ncbi:hypothetical protein I3V78_11815 [Archangium primigenium]|nr:hypothetical protein [Archangium primigenium]
MPVLSWRMRLGWFSAVVSLLFWGLVALRILATTDNHIGVDPWWASPLFLLTVLAGGTWWSANRRAAGATLMILGVLSLVGILLLDRLDILVEYEAWLERGMPERPF